MTMNQSAPDFQTIAMLLAIIAKQQAEFAKLEEHCKELEGRLKLNSRNSSKPPSTDGYAKPPSPGSSNKSDADAAADNNPDQKANDDKPNPKSLRQSSNRNVGGQPGHKGCTLKQVAAPDHTHCYPIKDCEICQRSLLSVEPIRCVERQVFEPGCFDCFEVTAHVAEVKECTCGHTNQARFPEGVNAHVQYGPKTQAFAVYLCQFQLIPYKRVSEFFWDIFGLEVSPGSICAFQDVAYTQLASTEQVIIDALINEPVAGADETGMRVCGTLWWMHVMRTDQWTLYHLDPSKGHSAMEKMGVLLLFCGVLVHDHYKAYFRYAAAHALCNAHHLRELQGVIDRDGNYLAARLQRLLRLAWHLTKGFRKAGMQSMPEVICKRIEAVFERTAKKAKDKEAESMELSREKLGLDKVKNTKAFNLFKRLVNFQEETLRFMIDFAVPFDNNGSEQDVRNGKVKQKISGSFRSEKGAKWYSRIRSYISSARKQGHHVFEALLIALKNYNNHPLLGAE